MDNYEAYLWECRKLDEDKKKRELEERLRPPEINPGQLTTSTQTTSIPKPKSSL